MPCCCCCFCYLENIFIRFKCQMSVESLFNCFYNLNFQFFNCHSIFHSCSSEPSLFFATRTKTNLVQQNLGRNFERKRQQQIQSILKPVASPSPCRNFGNFGYKSSSDVTAQLGPSRYSSLLKS